MRLYVFGFPKAYRKLDRFNDYCRQQSINNGVHNPASTSIATLVYDYICAIEI